MRCISAGCKRKGVWPAGHGVIDDAMFCTLCYIARYGHHPALVTKTAPIVIAPIYENLGWDTHHDERDDPRDSPGRDAVRNSRR